MVYYGSLSDNKPPQVSYTTQYTGRSYKCSSQDGLHVSSYFQIF